MCKSKTNPLKNHTAFCVSSQMQKLIKYRHNGCNYSAGKKKKGSSATNPISELLVIILNAFRIENDG